MKEEDLGRGGGQEGIKAFVFPNSYSDLEADSITETKDGRGVSTTAVSSSSSTEDVSPDEFGPEPKSFQGSSGSPAPTFPLRTYPKVVSVECLCRETGKNKQTNLPNTKARYEINLGKSI